MVLVGYPYTIMCAQCLKKGNWQRRERSLFKNHDIFVVILFEVCFLIRQNNYQVPLLQPLSNPYPPIRENPTKPNQTHNQLTTCNQSITLLYSNHPIHDHYQTVPKRTSRNKQKSQKRDTLPPTRIELVTSGFPMLKLDHKWIMRPAR